MYVREKRGWGGGGGERKGVGDKMRLVAREGGRDEYIEKKKHL